MARRRAAAKMGWYIHAAVYVAVNSMLAVDLGAGRPPLGRVPGPGLGPGPGDPRRGGLSWLTGGGGLYQRLIQQERERISLQRDPW